MHPALHKPVMGSRTFSGCCHLNMTALGLWSRPIEVKLRGTDGSTERERNKKVVKEFSVRRLLFTTAQIHLHSVPHLHLVYQRMYHTFSVKVCQGSGDISLSFPQLSSSFWPFVLPLMCCLHSSPSSSMQTTFVSETDLFLFTH